jgi:lipopolysaccharide exporter
VFPLAGGIFILAPEFTKIFLGEKWMPMVPATQVLVLFGLLRAIGATTGVIFMAVGKPEIRTKLQSAQLTLLAILIYPLTIKLGILGTAIAVTSYALVFNFVAVYKVVNITKSAFKKVAKIFILPLIATLFMISTAFILKAWLFINPSLFSFFTIATVGITTYFLAFYLFGIVLGFSPKLVIMEPLRVFVKR